MCTAIHRKIIIIIRNDLRILEHLIEADKRGTSFRVYKKKHDDNNMKFIFHSGRPNGHAAHSSHRVFMMCVQQLMQYQTERRVSHLLSHAANRAEIQKKTLLLRVTLKMNTFSM